MSYQLRNAFYNKAEKTTKMVGLPHFIIFCLLFSSLSSYCKTNGELKSPSYPLCNCGFCCMLGCFLKAQLICRLELNVPVVFLNEAAILLQSQLYKVFWGFCAIVLIVCNMCTFISIPSLIGFWEEEEEEGRGGGGRKRKKEGGRRKRRLTVYPKAPMHIIAF